MSDKQDKFEAASQDFVATFAAMTTRPVAGLVEYRLPDSETCVGTALLYEPGVAVQRAFMPVGAKFPPHAHAEVEHVIVYSGELQVTAGDTMRTLRAGEIVTFAPLALHECKALTDCWMIGITIPHSSGYPRG